MNLNWSDAASLEDAKVAALERVSSADADWWTEGTREQSNDAADGEPVIEDCWASSHGADGEWKNWFPDTKRTEKQLALCREYRNTIQY